MKKTLIIASALVFAASTSTFAVETVKAQKPANPPQKECTCQRPPKGQDFQKRSAEFEKRLKLTDEQKAKAKELREQGFEKMKPVMDKLKEKQSELREIKPDAVETEKAKAEQLHKEIGALRQEAHKLRMQNMKDFEAILTKKQLKELKKMKEEGRKKFDEEFKKHPRRDFNPEFSPRRGCDCPPPPPAQTK